MSGFGKKKSTRVELNDDFIDREVQQHAFRRHLFNVKNSGIDGGLLLIYSGVGRVGKTSLLKQFEKIIADEKFIFVRYNFDSNEFAQADDMLVTLKALRASLTKKYQVEFPLFDKGCIYLAQKSGEYVSAEQQRSVMKNSAMLRGFKAHLNSMKSKTDEAVTATKIINNLFDSAGEFLDDLSDTSLVLKAGKYFVDFLDGVIAAREEKARAEGDTDYGELLTELNKLNGEDAPAPIREILPRLFAKDLSFWLKAHDTNLIIFLDAYEKLTGEEQGKKKYGRLISENRDVPVDWWVGDLLTAGRVMWVIASRYKIKEIGEVDLEGGTVENYTVDVFDKNWSDKYLELQGISEEELRTAIINLTGGHPYYLRKCAETYINYKDKNKVPRPSDFGKNLDEIVEKTVGSLDESGQSMTQCLCVLKNWTDEVAADVIGNFNKFTYDRVKKMVARAEQLSFDEETGYTFDKTIDAFLFQSLKKDVTCRKLFTDIRAAANDYFKKFFDEGKLRRRYDSDSKHNYYFGMWSEIILRTTDAPSELMTLYDEHFEPLEERFDDLTLEVIFKKFFEKVGDNETLPSAYFQSRLGVIRYRQDRTKEALELAEAAYSKVEKLSLSNDELPFKISVMNILAEMFCMLSRHKNEIPLREEIIRECERCFPAKDDERTIKAKKELATALEWGDRKNEALELRRQIFELFDERDEEKYIRAAEDFADALESSGDYKSALPLRRKSVAFYEKNNDYENLYWSLYRLIDTLGNLSGKEYLEEKAERYSQYVALSKKTGEEISSSEFKDFAETLKKLGRNEEAKQLLSNIADDSAHRVEDLKRRIESFDEPNQETVELMKDLVSLLEEMNRNKEAKHWENKLKDTVRVIIERTCREPVENYDSAISMLEDINLSWWGYSYSDVNIALKRAILALTEKKSDSATEEIAAAKKELANEVRSKYKLTDEDKAEVEQLLEEIENYYRGNLPARREDFLEMLSDHADFLFDELHNLDAAIEKLTEAHDFLEKDSKATDNEILDVMQKIANVFDNAKNSSEETAWRERILAFCQENLLEDASETLNALDNLIWLHERLKNYDKVEQYRQQRHIIKENNLGSSHKEVIDEKENIADTLHDSGKYEEEIKLRKQIIKLYRENFSANAENKKGWSWFGFIRAMKKLAECLDDTRQKNEALEIRKQIVAEQKDHLQELKENFASAGDIIRAMDDVADALNEIKDYEEELHYRLDLVKFCREKKAKFDEIIRALESLARFYSERDRADEELEICKQIVTEQKDHLQELKENSASAGDIISAMDDVADALNEIKDYEAELRYRLDLVKFCREKDVESKYTIRALESLACFYYERDRADEELEIRNQIVDEQKEHIKELKESSAEDYEIINAMDDVARALNDVGDYEEELRYRLDLVDFCREKKADFDDTICALESLADFYSERYRADEELEIRRQIVDERKENIQELKENFANDWEIIRAMDNVADALNKVEDYDEELRYRLDLVDFCREKKADFDDTIRALESLADFYSERDRADDELEIRKQIVDGRKKHLQELKDNCASNYDIINATDDVVDALNKVEDYDEELRYRLELVEFLKDKDADFDDIIRALESLVDFYSEHDKTDEALETYRKIIEDYKDYFAENQPEKIDEIQEKINALTQGDESEEELEEEPTEETEEQSTEIDTSESLALRKGQRVPLKKNNPALDKLTVDFHWEGDADLEIDASAFLLGTDGKTHADEDFVFYGNNEHQSGSVKYSSGDAQASMQIELKKIPDEVARISFTLTLYEAEEREQNFGRVKVFARVIDEAARKEIFRFDLQEAFTVETAIVVGEIYRHKGEWKFNAVGAGFTGGLAALCKNFGVEVD